MYGEMGEPLEKRIGVAVGMAFARTADCDEVVERVLGKYENDETVAEEYESMASFEDDLSAYVESYPQELRTAAAEAYVRTTSESIAKQLG